MAGARAATSLSLTIGAAFATLLVVGGILTGPAILDCSHQGASIGACLRGKIVQSGLLPEDQPSAVLPTQAAPATPETSREPGWIEANATEYEGQAPGVARLRAPSGILGADGSAAGSLAAAVEIAIAEPPGTIEVDGTASRVSDPAGAAELHADPAGGLTAHGRAEAVIDPAATLLAPLPGAVLATGRDGAATPMSGTTRASPRSAPLATGSIGPTIGRSASAALEASLDPVMPSIMPPVLAPPPPVTPQAAPQPERAPRTMALPRPHRLARPPIKYDPHYPNVLVLPPPNTGANSSFATLEVR